MAVAETAAARKLKLILVTRAVEDRLAGRIHSIQFVAESWPTQPRVRLDRVATAEPIRIGAGYRITIEEL